MYLPCKISALFLTTIVKKGFGQEHDISHCFRLERKGWQGKEGKDIEEQAWLQLEIFGWVQLGAQRQVLFYSAAAGVWGLRPQQGVRGDEPPEIYQSELSRRKQ